MTPNPPPPKMTARDVLDAYFLETRAKLLEVAANLDRLDRSPGAGDLSGDPRLAFIQGALEIVRSAGPGRAERIQRLYSKE